MIQLLDPEQQGWAAVPQAEGQLWDCQRGRPAGLSSVSSQLDKVFSLGLGPALYVFIFQVLEVCQDLTELNLTVWRARIEGREVEILPEVITQSSVGLKHQDFLNA